MFLFTVVTFAIVAAALTKLVWRPMLEALDKREAYLRQSLEDAERIEQEMAALDEKKEAVLAEADAQGRDILSRARRAGTEAERVIRDKAREEAVILMENARREIRAAHEKARADLRQASVDTAIALAGRLIRENLDDRKNRELTDRLIEQL
jgi:F-type H+-transporting ATPase subunit b